MKRCPICVNNPGYELQVAYTLVCQVCWLARQTFLLVKVENYPNQQFWQPVKESIARCLLLGLGVLYLSYEGILAPWRHLQVWISYRISAPDLSWQDPLETYAD